MERTYTAYVVPNANIRGKRKTLVLQSALGLKTAAGLTPELKVAFLVEGSNTTFRSQRSFYRAIRREVNEKDSSRVEKILLSFQRVYRGVKLTRMIPEGKGEPSYHYTIGEAMHPSTEKPYELLAR